MAEQEPTPQPTPPPKESPFGQPAPSGDNRRRSSRIAIPEETQAAVVVPRPDATLAANGGTPKTIRVIRPPTPAYGAQPPRPGANPLPPGPKPLSEPLAQASKAKTSRISLESAIGSEQTAGLNAQTPLVQPGMDGPLKTIRLKRPSEMPTLKVPVVHPVSPLPAPSASPRPTAPISGVPTPSKTSKLPESESAAADPTVPLTQKRTIRVKRPGAAAAAAPDAATITGADGTVLTPIAPEEALPRPAPDTCNPLFLITAIAALLVTGVLIALFYQQMFGASALY